MVNGQIGCLFASLIQCKQSTACLDSESLRYSESVECSTSEGGSGVCKLVVVLAGRCAFDWPLREKLIFFSDSSSSLWGGLSSYDLASAPGVCSGPIKPQSALAGTLPAIFLSSSAKN